MAEKVVILVGHGGVPSDFPRDLPSMLTPGGVHSEVEIPEALTALRAAFPGTLLRYAWPFDVDRVSDMLAAQVRGR